MAKLSDKEKPRTGIHQHSPRIQENRQIQGSESGGHFWERYE